MAFHEHNLLPFSTPQSYALLSAESKTTEAANNKERLVVCHFIVWRRTILVACVVPALLQYITSNRLPLVQFSCYVRGG